MADLVIEPEQLLVGLSYADRPSLCTLIALYEESYLQKLVLDMFKDGAAWAAGELKQKLTGAENDSEGLHRQERRRAFEKRLLRKSDGLRTDSVSDASLRLRLWMHLRDGLGLGPALAFYRLESRRLVEELAERVRAVFARQLDDQEARRMKFFSREYWKDYARVRLNPFSNRTVNDPTFADVVRMNTLSIIGAAAARGELPGELQAELTGRVHRLVADLQPEERRQLLARYGAEQVTDDSAMRMLLDAQGLFRLGLGKEVAGLAAYILVANSSALVPLLGGSALAGTTAVLANPLFLVPVMLLGGVFLARNLKHRVRQSFGIAATTILVLKAIAERKSGTDPILKVFRELPEHLPGPLVAAWQAASSQPPTEQTEPRGRHLLGDTARRLGRWAREGFVSEEYPRAADYLECHRQIERAADDKLMEKASACLKEASRLSRLDSKLRRVDDLLDELVAERDGQQTVSERPARLVSDTDPDGYSLDDEDFTGEDTEPDPPEAALTLQQTVFDPANPARRARSARAGDQPGPTAPAAPLGDDTALGRVPLEKLDEDEPPPPALDRQVTVQGRAPLDDREVGLAAGAEEPEEE